MRAIVALLMASLGCTPGPYLRAQHAVTVPLAGAPRRLGVNTLGAQVGVIDKGTGARVGAVLDVRARLPGDDVVGGSGGLSFVGAYVPASRSSPFLLANAGLGVLGSSSLAGEENSAFDILSPRLETSVGIPTSGGSSISLGVSLDLINRIDKPNLWLLGFTIGFGVFDPRLARGDGLFGRLE